jgi:hypothetical protein
MPRRFVSFFCLRIFLSDLKKAFSKHQPHATLIITPAAPGLIRYGHPHQGCQIKVKTRIKLKKYNFF